MKKLDCKPIFIALTLLVTSLLGANQTFGESYSYDELGRLTSVRYDDGGIVRFTYDLTGNILSRSTGQVSEPKNHVIEANHPSFSEIEQGKRYRIDLSRDESVEITIRNLSEDGSTNVTESVVTANARRIEVIPLSQTTRDGAAKFTITAKALLGGLVTFTTNLGTISLRERP